MVKRLYIVKGLLVLVGKASFSKEFRCEFHSGGEGYSPFSFSRPGRSGGDEPGGSGLPYYCIPPVCVPDVIGALLLCNGSNIQKKISRKG